MATQVLEFSVTTFLHELSPSIREFRGVLKDGTPVYVKECRSKDLSTASDELLGEASRLLMMSSEHTLIRHSHAIRNEGEEWCFQLALEWADDSLEKHFPSRTLPRTEEELWTFLRDFVQLLARGQTIGFAHRNINPKSFFFSIDRRLKLGNFGCSMTFPCRSQFPKNARVSHMAPEVRSIHFVLQISEQTQPPPYDVYKADVYSLGLTALQIATALPLPHDPLAAVDTLPYGAKLCGVLKLMLQNNADLRPDFLGLVQIIFEVEPQLYRPSSRSTASSERLIVSRLSEMQCKNLSFAELWMADANSSSRPAANLAKLWAFQKDVQATATLTLRCNNGCGTYTVSVLESFTEVDLLVCSFCRNR